MLIDAQIKKHWRRWSAVAAANDWVMQGGRLIAASLASAADLNGIVDMRRSYETPLHDSIYQRLVWKTAEALALQEHRSITADDLRHACYAVATTHVPGRSARTPVATSIKDLENWSFSRLLNLWGDEKGKAGLLIEPDCVTSSMAWDHPERDREAWLDEELVRQPRARLEAICRNAFDCVSWRELDAGKKEWLLRKVRGERRRFNKPVAVAGIEEPF